MTAVLECAGCRARFDLDLAVARCRACGGLLDLVTNAEPGDWRARFAGPDRSESGVWRYRELVHPAAEDRDLVSFPEGNTPLVVRRPLADWAGVERIAFKHEGMNPTASFKDRGMTVAVTQAKRVRATAVVCASTGNTSASMAAYAAQAGIPGVVLVPAGKITTGKLAQTVAYGARILAVRGDFDACLRLVDEAQERLGLYLANSINPFRLAGQKTIGLELLQQRGWRAPDWLVLPGGNLGNTAAIGRALVEAQALGLIDRLPRLGVIQAAGAAPFARSFPSFRERTPVIAETVASAIRIGNPASWDRAVAVIRATDGVVTSVTDAAIMEAKRAIDRAGVGCEPASAASLAGVRRMVEEGTIRRTDDVVAILTGHVLKDPDAAMASGSPPTEIDPTLGSLELALRG
jgi:threonine synthase